MNKSENIKVVKKRKIKIKAIIISLILIAIAALIFYYISNIHITNIYIIDNEFLSDYEIIKIAKLENYPNSMNNSSKKIKERLEKNDFIRSAKVNASEKVVQPAPLIRFSQIPITKAPRTAPGTEPIPPNTAATKAFSPGIAPDMGLMPV